MTIREISGLCAIAIKQAERDGTLTYGQTVDAIQEVLERYVTPKLVPGKLVTSVFSCPECGRNLVPHEGHPGEKWCPICRLIPMINT